MSTENDTVDMDKLFDIGVEMDQVRDIAEADLLPNGSYMTVTPATFTLKQFDAKDGREARLIGRVYAAVVPRGEGRDGRIGFAFSPNKVLREDGSPDRSSKNYAQLVTAYKAAYGTDPKNMGDLKDYVTNYPLQLRVIQVGTQEGATGEPGNLVVNISAVKE